MLPLGKPFKLDSVSPSISPEKPTIALYGLLIDFR